MKNTLLGSILALLIGCSYLTPKQHEEAVRTGVAPKGLKVCPLHELPDSATKPINLRVFDPRTNTEVTDRDQLAAMATYELRGDVTTPYYCTESTMEVTLEKSLGYPAQKVTSKPCQGPNCKTFSVLITTQPGRAFYWKARVWRHDRCATDGVCHADDEFYYASNWHGGPTLRAKDFWATHIGHNISEHFNVKGQPLGDESEDSRSRAEDGNFMNFGSALDDDNKNQVVAWITPIKFDNRYNVVEGELFYTSQADAPCQQVLSIHDFIDNVDVVLSSAPLSANQPMRTKIKLPASARRYITPAHNVFDKSGFMQLRATCKGSAKPFVYGADLILMSTTEMAYDQAGDRD